MITIFKYQCPACGIKLLRAPMGFLGLASACSDACNTSLKVQAEQQFTIWQFTSRELNTMYWRTVRVLKLLDQDITKLTYTHFIAWLYIKHGYSKIELTRIYNGLAEGKDE
jgi:hypothetical protein